MPARRALQLIRAAAGASAAVVVLALMVVALMVPSTPATAAENSPPAAAAGEPADQAEHERLLRENAALSERLRVLEGQRAVAERLDAQASRLATLAARLDARLAELDGEAAETAMVGEVAREQALQRRLASSERARQEAEDEVDALGARVAELEARLKQQQLTVDEALLRADKAEKLHAALEEAHAQVRTENERLSLELATAKERQAEAVQRVLELDNRLEAVSARARSAAPTMVSDVLPADSGGPHSGAPSDREPKPQGAGGEEAAPGGRRSADAGGRSKPVYEVRAEDTLSRIAGKVYGDPSAWRRIFEANRDVLNGPDELRLGMRLIIP